MLGAIQPFKLDFKNDCRGLPLYASLPFPTAQEETMQAGMSCWISSSFAGDMKYEAGNQNRLTLFKELKFNPDSVFGLQQIHSRSVLVVDRNNPPGEKADGMVTRDHSITLSVTVADCLPVFLHDVKTGAFGLVHSGWKGTGIAVAAINLMKESWGTEAGDVAAVLGPCIDSCCYKVDAQRAEVFAKEFGEDCVRVNSGDFYLDLKGANVKLLADAGVRNITVCADCTFTDERLGSFRRQGEQFTRMIALLKSDCHF